MLSPMGNRCAQAHLNASRGFSLLEVTIALSISGLLFASLWQLTGIAGQNREAGVLITKTMTVAVAAQDYVKGQRGVLLDLPELAALNDLARVKITDADTGDTADSVQSAGYLPSDFVNINSYGQSYALFVRREDGGTLGVADTGDRLTALLVSTGGSEISDTLGAKLASGMGAPGGFLYDDSNPAPPAAATTARGTAGGWTLDLTEAGWTDIGNIAQAGHMAVMVSLAPSGGTAAAPPPRDSIDALDDGITNYASLYNVFMGQGVGSVVTSSAGSTGFGYSAMSIMTSGGANTAFGAHTLRMITNATNNAGIGYGVLRNNSGGTNQHFNTGIGSEVFSQVGSEAGNTAVGYRAMLYGYNRQYNTAIGSEALRGTSSLAANTGQQNTVVGRYSMRGGGRQQGNANTLFGAYIIPSFNGGNYASNNSALGYEALYSLSSSSNLVGLNNTALGYRAGYNITTGNSNVLIGAGVNARTATTNSEINIGDLIYYGLVQGTYNAFTIDQTTGTTGVSFDIGTKTDSARLAVGTSAQRPTCDASHIGAMRYNISMDTFEMCHPDGYWINMVLEGGSSVSTPVGSGFFVMSSSTRNANLGGLAGANAYCLNEVTANDWMGKADASSRGQLVASKVRAYLTTSGVNNNFLPNTTYYFARAGRTDVGGAPFTSDGTGRGPGNPSPWSAQNYFGTAIKFWMGSRDYSTNYAGTNGCCTGYCSNWGSSSSGENTTAGSPAAYGNARFTGNASCNTPLYILCMVHP